MAPLECTYARAQMRIEMRRPCRWRYPRQQPSKQARRLHHRERGYRTVSVCGGPAWCTRSTGHFGMLRVFRPRARVCLSLSAVSGVWRGPAWVRVCPLCFVASLSSCPLIDRVKRRATPADLPTLLLGQKVQKGKLGAAGGAHRCTVGGSVGHRGEAARQRLVGGSVGHRGEAARQRLDGGSLSHRGEAAKQRACRWLGESRS